MTEILSIDGAYQKLAGAICVEAFNEYQGAYKRLLNGDRRVKNVIAGIEKFFRSEWFQLLTHGAVDPDFIIKKARETCKTSKHFYRPTSQL